MKILNFKFAIAYFKRALVAPGTTRPREWPSICTLPPRSEPIPVKKKFRTVDTLHPSQESTP